MKKFILPVLMFSFVFSIIFSAAPQKAEAWKIYCTDGGNGIWGDNPGEILTGYWWQKRGTCASHTFFRSVGSPEIPVQPLNESIADFSTGLSSIVSGINPASFSPLVRNTTGPTAVNIVRALYGTGFFQNMPEDNTPFGPMSVTAANSFSQAFGLSADGQFGSDDARALQMFSSDINTAIQSLLSQNINPSNFSIVFPTAISVFNAETGIFNNPINSSVFENNLNEISINKGGSVLRAMSCSELEDFCSDICSGASVESCNSCYSIFISKGCSFGSSSSVQPGVGNLQLN